MLRVLSRSIPADLRMGNACARWWVWRDCWKPPLTILQIGLCSCQWDLWLHLEYQLEIVLEGKQFLLLLALLTASISWQILGLVEQTHSRNISWSYIQHISEKLLIRVSARFGSSCNVLGGVVVSDGDRSVAKRDNQGRYDLGQSFRPDFYVPYWARAF